MSEAASYSFDLSRVSGLRKTIATMASSGLVCITVGSKLEDNIRPEQLGRESLETQIENEPNAMLQQSLQEREDALTTQHYEYTTHALAVGLVGGLAIRAGYVGIRHLLGK